MCEYMYMILAHVLSYVRHGIIANVANEQLVTKPTVCATRRDTDGKTVA